ncbi:hypothetical protein SO802_019635 [Lithocarpus litseifolius]|uniref:RNA methyltransferase n=1 Tax=Lithocarpus litseifolius TaxID=425828 RepID=A0AAW2CPA8_9ROSI
MEQQHQHSKRKRKPVFVFGNYKNYYGYRQKSFAAEAFLELILILGGVLVLEPQPWKSYENNRLVSETTAMNYRSILFRPAKFQEILLDKIGFRKVEDITSHLSGSKAGFNRPILVFHK